MKKVTTKGLNEQLKSREATIETLRFIIEARDNTIASLEGFIQQHTQSKAEFAKLQTQSKAEFAKLQTATHQIAMAKERMADANTTLVKMLEEVRQEFKARFAEGK